MLSIIRVADRSPRSDNNRLDNGENLTPVLATSILPFCATLPFGIAMNRIISSLFSLGCMQWLWNRSE
jgi:hypothetical protein